MPENNELKILNVGKWLDENKANFLPPVCNKLMHNEQLVIMFVGGPNQREDYHIEEGEELFYQLKGDMCVKIIENNQHKDIHIREGEFFLLPARIPHSPQRTENSIGLVIERKREQNEIDGVRWHIPNTTESLYEKWFHCKDLGVELVPLIKQYFNSSEYKTKQPLNNVVDKSKLPFSLNSALIDKSKHGSFNLYEKINSSTTLNVINLSPAELKLQFEVFVLKKGTHLFSNSYEIDTWLWQLNGKAKINLKECSNTNNDQIYNLSQDDSLLVPALYCQQLIISIDDENDFILKVTQNPRLKNFI